MLLPNASGELVLPTFGPEGPVWPEEAQRPTVRTYTPRRYDEATNTLEIQFAMHSEGPASDWALSAKPGDSLAVAGPGGRFDLDPTAKRWWIAGDESAIPAIAMLLEALPADAAAEVHIEVADAEDELALDSDADVSITWHHRESGAFGAELLAAAAAAELAQGTHVWVGCEASTVRTIRRHALEAAQPRDALTTRGYWRLGEANHPDHDYGDD